MFEKLKKIFKNREEKEKHNYDLTFDNVAIPEVHVKSASRKPGSMANTIMSAAALVGTRPRIKKKSGTPTSSAPPKQMSWRFVSPNTTLDLTLVKSLGTVT